MVHKMAAGLQFFCGFASHPGDVSPCGLCRFSWCLVDFPPAPLVPPLHPGVLHQAQGRSRVEPPAWLCSR